MKTIKVDSLTTLQLDYIVTQLECSGLKDNVGFFRVQYLGYAREFHYCTDWKTGGPVLERQGIAIQLHQPSIPPAWVAMLPGTEPCVDPSPLIAAMRCYVKHKLGDEVEVPQALLTH